MDDKPVQIKMTKVKGGYYAEIEYPYLPGSPSVGTGRTRIEAILALFIRSDYLTVIRIKRQSGEFGIMVNGQLWRDILGASKR